MAKAKVDANAADEDVVDGQGQVEEEIPSHAFSSALLSDFDGVIVLLLKDASNLLDISKLEQDLLLRVEGPSKDALLVARVTLYDKPSGDFSMARTTKASKTEGVAPTPSRTCLPRLRRSLEKT